MDALHRLALYCEDGKVIIFLPVIILRRVSEKAKVMWLREVEEWRKFCGQTLVMKLTVDTYLCFDRCVFLSLLLLYKTVLANESTDQL